MAEALVQSDVLKWARERAGLSIETLAKKVGSRVNLVEAWEAGSSRPTFKQAEKFAQATHVPFGYLFLPEPPIEQVAIPDLRSTTESRLPHLDANFKDTLSDVLFKFDWYRGYRVEQGHESLPFVGRFKKTANSVEVAEDIKRTLGLDKSDREEAGNFQDYYNRLVVRAEAAGIWIMRNGVVEGNTRRPLSVDIFRGFAISDPLLPTIFINASDAKAAQIFTLAHELAHLWLGQSGISDPLRHLCGLEKKCNAIAAEFLLPQDDFISVWDNKKKLAENVQQLSEIYRVSRIVVAIRALELGKIDQSKFTMLYDFEREDWAGQRKKEKTKGGGGDYYRTAKVKNGKHFQEAVLACTMSGNMLLRYAGDLLNMSPNSVIEAYRRQQERI